MYKLAIFIIGIYLWSIFLVQSQAASDCKGTEDCCSTKDKCKDGDGDCDRNTDCISGLCGSNNCDTKRFPSFDSSDDCCMSTIASDCKGGDDCCSPESRCKDGHGDCDTGLDCISGQCGDNNCNTGRFPSFEGDDDCCVPTNAIDCKGGNDGNCCSPERKCRDLDGDCDSDEDCLSGKCGTDNCDYKTFPSFDKEDDCCLNGEVSGCDGGNGCCGPDNKCNEGEGDCDDDEDCLVGHCGRNNCYGLPGDFDQRDDCCTRAVCKGEPGCCTNNDPCELGEGDCDNYNDCKGGLSCGTNNCNRDLYPQFTEQDDCCKYYFS